MNTNGTQAGGSDRELFATYFSPAGRVTIAALVVTAALCTMDRMLLSLVVDPVRQDLGISETQIGLLQGLAFSLMYSIAGIPLGLLADRVARGKLLAGAVLVWSLGTILCGLAYSFEFFFLSRVLVGAGEAALWPVAVSLIGDLVPTRNRGNVISWVIIGQLLGGSFSLIVGGKLIALGAAGHLDALPAIGGLAPWRMLFILFGLAGAVAIALLLAGAEPERSPTERHEAGAHPLAGLKMFWRFCIENRKSIGSVYLLTTTIAVVQYSGAAWNMPLLLRRFDYGPQEVGAIMGVVMLVAGAIGSLGGGFLSKRTGQDPVKRCNVIIGCYVLSICYGMLAFNPSFTVSVAVCAIPATLIAMAGVITIVIIQDIVPSNMRGVAMAINHLFASLLGASAGPVIVASLTQYVFRNDNMVGVSLGLVVGIALIAAALISMVIKRQIVLRYREVN